jgi:hypothetical protein
MDETTPITKLGFLISRHMNNEENQQYWIFCVHAIRKHCGNHPIIIVDNGSDPQYLQMDPILLSQFTNCMVVNNDWVRSGEFGPYHYLYKTHCFEKAVCIHDSMFINAPFDFESIMDNVKPLLHFTIHKYDDDEEIYKMIDMLKPETRDIVKTLYDEKCWNGCYGVQSVISYDCIVDMQEKYNIFGILPLIQMKKHRQCVERLFAVIAHLENPALFIETSLFGDMCDTCDKGLCRMNILPFSTYKDIVMSGSPVFIFMANQTDACENKNANHVQISFVKINGER